MERIIMETIPGFVFLTLLSYIFIVLNVPFLIIPVVLIILFLVVTRVSKNLHTFKLPLTARSIVIITVFVIGILGQLAVISPSGSKVGGDLVFWSAHGHDGSWHVALMEEFKKGFPFQNPVFAGEKLVNYHFFSDILPAIVGKYLPIASFDLYFKVFPPIYSLFLGVSAYFLTKKLTGSFAASIWAVVFTYFSGSFGYLIGKGESVFWATQPQSSSGNPPQIISNFIVLSAIYFLLKFLEKKNIYNFSICVLLFGTASSFKIYAGVVLLASLTTVSIWYLIKERKLEMVFMSLLSGTLAAIQYFPNSSGSGSYLIFEPWWYIRTMIVEPSRLNLLDWELKRQTYIAEHNWKRVIYLEGLGFLIFFFGNLGMRFIGLLEYMKTHLVIKIAVLISLILPLLFLQKGVASNTSQFLQYWILFFGILAGIATAKITSKFKFLIPIIIIFMIPTQTSLLKEFYSRPAFTKISSGEIQALEFVRKNTSIESIILTPPFNQYLDLKDPIPNIWDWFDTSYVSAISARRTYFDDYEQVDIMGYDYKQRFEIKKTIFESESQNDVYQAFVKSKSTLLYFPKALRPKVGPDRIGLVKIFENQAVEVWKAK